MSFNISGIAVNRNFQANLGELTRQFNWNLQFVGETDFETASSNWKEEGLCDVYFSANGTLLFVHMDLCVEPWQIREGNTFTFALSETSMAFNLNYCVDRELVRSLMEINGEVVNSDGQPLPVETAETDTAELILAQIGEVIGKQFGAIEPGEKAYRYRFVTNEANRENTAEVEAPETSGAAINEMIEVYIREGNEKVEEIISFVEQHKSQKNRHGKLIYLCKTNVEFPKQNLDRLNQQKDIIGLQRITNEKYGPGYLVTFRTGKLSFLERIKQLFAGRK